MDNKEDHNLLLIKVFQFPVCLLSMTLENGLVQSNQFCNDGSTLGGSIAWVKRHHKKVSGINLFIQIICQTLSCSKPCTPLFWILGAVTDRKHHTS